MGQLLAMQLNLKECLAAHICIRPRAIGDAAGGRQADRLTTVLPRKQLPKGVKDQIIGKRVGERF